MMEDNKFVDKLAPLQDLWANILEIGRQGVEVKTTFLYSQHERANSCLKLIRSFVQNADLK